MSIDEQIIEPVGYDFGVTRRSFVQVLGAGILIAASGTTLFAQERRRGGRREQPPVALGARLHIGKDDGQITVMSGKVEGGQGARAQITQAAAEELRVDVDRIRLILADTSLVPDDGITAGSRTTPSTLPAVRQACAAARELLVALAAQRWQVAADRIDVRDGVAVETSGARRITYADLASADHSAEAFKRTAPADVKVVAVDGWKVLGQSLPRPNAREIVTGAHAFPSDVVRPGMLYGKVLRPPTYRAKLTAVDLAGAKSIEGVIVARDEGFVGVAAPNTRIAKQAIQAIEKTSTWEPAPHPASRELSDHLRRQARGGVPANPFAHDVPPGGKSLRASYSIPYAQHAPLEPRAAVAEWSDGKLTVWTATQNPFGVRRELAGAFHLNEDKVRVIVPDFGGGFGGKHTGETAVEAARLAQAAGKPVAVRWTRAEEFTFAAFRPAAAIDIEATLDSDGTLWSWHYININSGRPGIDCPYRVERKHVQFVESDPPLRHGSYRALATTANQFARESFMDELAALAGRDPLEFRRAHLDQGRLRDVLDEAAKRFGWLARRAEKRGDGHGIGLSCGTDKGSFVAACVEVLVDPTSGAIRVLRVCQAFECGAITSTLNLRSQVEGAIVMGLGPALRESVEFENGGIATASFWNYQVPRMQDLPEIEVHLIDRRDLPSAGAGETPLVAVAPAIGNAVCDATGLRARQMPIRLTRS
jgi:isoquinoline 1-oxidoreductase